MKTLALELSTARGSLALRDGNLEWTRDWANDRKNSGEFFTNLAEVQNRFGPPGRIIVGLGPGSYAGTRIAISAAIGLHCASNAELIGLSSLGALESDESEYVVVGDARRQSFFIAQVRDRILVAPPELQSEDQVRTALAALGGRSPVFAVENLRQFEGVRLQYPSARILARLAAEPNRSFLLPPLEPMYLREPHITTPRPK